ncbi:hypothetical protein Y1Q_0009462 [Alligator mississippiensis]|uniref:Secreted protein n=1 Tax=Alligator mississippiensis TaxID=8496 RepID=A0A151NKA6_ALLMI|nr:hypothetical protein Y1Q_0009462 [Alligator mississippiensis]
MESHLMLIVGILNAVVLLVAVMSDDCSCLLPQETGSGIQSSTCPQNFREPRLSKRRLGERRLRELRWCQHDGPDPGEGTGAGVVDKGWAMS